MDFPNIQCLNPKLIRNKYTDKVQLSSCGICKACLLRKSKVMSFRCSLHEQNYKYCYFVTLTYSNEHIPLVEFVDNPASNGYFLITHCKRHSDYRRKIGYDNDGIGFIKYQDMPKCGLQLLLTKFNLGGFVPYAYFRDAQLFLKRLRKQYNKYDSEEKIKYYLCSEYGPVHFRPHYHIIFFHNSDKIHSEWRENICACWPYGRIDASTSRGKCSSYVASYVNSSCSLPSIFSAPELHPKNSHSSHLGCEIPFTKIAQIYDNDPREFMSQCVNFGSNCIEFAPWRAYEDNVFPRCKEYSTKSYNQLFKTYGIITEVRQRYGAKTIAQYAKLIYKDMFSLKYRYKKSYVIDYFKDSLDIREFCAKHCYSTWKYVDDWWCNQIQSELYLSKRFVDVICGGDMSLFTTRLKQLIHYYDVKELLKLNTFYQNQSDYALKTKDKLSIMLFYDNLKDFGVDGSQYITDAAIRLYYQLGGFTPKRNIFSCVNVQSASIFNEFHNAVLADYEKSIKHKKQNDLNKIFL